MKTILGAIPIALILAGCGSSEPPRELVSARSAYNRAAQGPASQVNPTDLHEAHNALNRAEQSFIDRGNTPETKDLSYVAQRRAQLAETMAQGEQANQQARLTSAEIEKKKDTALAEARGTVNTQQQVMTAQQQKLQDEKVRREDAERRAMQAATDLAHIAIVKQEPRGVVITLSGSVLFPSNQSTILPNAQSRLNQVAEALTKSDPDSKIVVQGHTDSQGKAATNNELSQKRAQAVRDFLVARGIASDRITAEGLGPTQPVADNESPEGRANNRRVEIVIQPPTPKP